MHGTKTGRMMTDARPTRRTAVAVAAAVALAGALAGCSSNAPADDEPTLLRVGIASLADTDSLDPSAATTTGGYVFASQVFDTLTEYGTSGAWEPSLAESVTPGDTADHWTVTLKDATWHDGTPVTADDVVATVKRWFADELPPSGALPFIDPDRVTATDHKTVEFELNYPTVTFPEALTSPTTSIVPATFDPAEPVGSGPFVVDDVQPGIQFAFTANEDYWAGDVGYDELQIISFDSATTEVNALTGKQIDLAANMDPSLVSAVEGTQGLEIFSYPTSGTLTWVMNVEQAPFDNVAARQALATAIDRQQLIDQVYNGYASLGNDIFSPFDPMYNDDIPQREADPEAAKKILEEAGYTLPVSVELWGAPNQPTSDRQNEVLVEQAAKAGFDVTFHQVDVATFYGDAYGTYPLSLSFWGFLGIFDQAAFTITDDAPYNSSHWQDDEYNALYYQALETVDDAERKALVAQMQQIEHDRGAYIVPIFLDKVVAYSDTVTGLEPYPNTDGAIGYHFWTLSPAE